MAYALKPIGTRHDGVAIAQELDTILCQAREEQWDVGAVVTDDAGQCGRARRILALRWPNIAFLHCFAHDINNLVKAVLKTTFRHVACRAADIVNALNAASSTWLKQLRDIMERRYNKRLALYALCETRWNSMQACFASLLRVRKALEILCCEYSGVTKFPAPLLVLKEAQFWKDLAEAESTIRPLSAASYCLQRDQNTVADVVASYRNIYCKFSANSEHREALLPLVDQRWRKCEQPLFMLGYFLHPRYVDKARQLPITSISLPAASHISQSTTTVVLSAPTSATFAIV
uniref:DUF659 domain-containing protein n=1 Tax=Globisporangium ultimum (strain ATCC 200006 / CBS 805.95 / DAOM BR144) TaxID=431595 RepID=K3XCR3_GLOUD